MLAQLAEKSLLLRGLLDTVFPPLCLGCGRFIEDDRASCICPACWKKIEIYAHPICLNCFEFLPNRTECPTCGKDSVPVFVFANYSSPIQDIVIQFKFRGIAAAAEEFAPRLYEQFCKPLESLQAEMIIPIPLYPSRERFRGYNQAALFAEQVAKLLHLPMREDILFRVKKRKPQAKLKLQKRMVNIEGVFAVAEEVEHKANVILVDDVVTSGATVSEARKVLERAGYTVSGVVAIAHGI